MFVFLSLAMAKRDSELRLMMAGGRTNVPGRGYKVEDLALLQTCGVSAGYISVLALYINSSAAQGLYPSPQVLWLRCPMLPYWLMRVWLKTSRGTLHDDPIVFALKGSPQSRRRGGRGGADLDCQHLSGRSPRMGAGYASWATPRGTGERRIE